MSRQILDKSEVEGLFVGVAAALRVDIILDSISPTSAGFGAESFVHADLAFLSVTISCCLPRFDGPHDFVGDPENLVDFALYRIRRGSLSQS